MHPEHVIACAKAGKHVVVEKPMALRLQDADDMIRACDEAGVKLFVVKQNRFNVPVVKAREALEAGRFGRLVLGTVRVRWCRDQAYYDQDDWRGTWAYDGGVLTNQASHHVDMLEWFFGDVVSVHARAITALAKIETEDTAVATLKFRNGALGIIEATTAARPTDLEGSLSILGEKGTVEIAGFAVNQIRHWRFVDELPSDKDVIEKFSVNPPNVYGFGHQAYYQHVIDCLINQRAALVDGLEGRKSLELISALYELIETGQEVPLRFTPAAEPAWGGCREPAGTRSRSACATSNSARGSRSSSPAISTAARSATIALSGRSPRSRRASRIGARTRVQSHAFICELVTIGEDCFVGHGVMFINDTFSTGGPARRAQGVVARDRDRQSRFDRLERHHHAGADRRRCRDRRGRGGDQGHHRRRDLCGQSGAPARAQMSASPVSEWIDRCRYLLRICSCSTRRSRARSTVRSPPSSATTRSFAGPMSMRSSGSSQPRWMSSIACPAPTAPTRCISPWPRWR